MSGPGIRSLPDASAMHEHAAGAIVIGAGVAGAGVAWRLAQRGMKVVVVEHMEPTHAATWAAAGMLTPLAEAGHDEAFLRLSERALSLWPAFAAELSASGSGDPGFTASGRLQLAPDEEAAAPLRALVASDHGRRAGALWMDAGQAARLEPELHAGLVGAALFPGDASADPRRLGNALRTAATQAGATFVRGRVTSVEHDVRGVSGVRLHNESVLATRIVVVAAGAWAAEVQGLPAPLPVRPMRGEMYAVHARVGLLRHIVWSPGCYLVPRPDGRILVGATMEDVGFAPGPTTAGIASLRRAAAAACPVMATLPSVEEWAGFRPATPDAMPILGRDSRMPGLVHASGLFRNGILLAPVVADAVAAEASGDAAAIDLAPFAPMRPGLS